MKEIVSIAVVFLAFSIGAMAQTFSEFFEQKKTQIKYLKAQIAALEAYKAVLEKGYQVAKDGLQIIGQIKQGDLDLHSGHFALLREVNPAIRDDPRVSDVYSLVMKIGELGEQIGKLSQDRVIQSMELNGLVAGFIGTLTETTQTDLDLLDDLKSDGGLSMSDDERLEAIYQLRARMVERYRLALIMRDNLLPLPVN